MKKTRRIKTRETPKGLRKLHVSFTVDGKRVRFTKVEKIPRRHGIKYYAKRRTNLPRSIGSEK